MPARPRSLCLRVAAALSLGLALVPRAAHAIPDTLGDTTLKQAKPGDDSQLRFLAYYLTRAEVSNIAPTNDLLQGQVIGRLFGLNSTTTARDKVSAFVEQRFIPYFVFEPNFLNRYARVRASFELRWTWGDTNYGVGGNFGGAINGHQVNIQTQNVEVEVNLPWRGWFVNMGLLRLFDSPRDLYRSLFSTLSYTGQRLAYWGADAVGVTVHGHLLGQFLRAGVYNLYENKISEDDNVLLMELVTDRHLGRTLHVGGSLRYLRDASNGAGGISILSQGPRSQLAEYNGSRKFKIDDPVYQTHVAWVGLDASYNPEFTAGRLGFSAFVVGNFGVINSGKTRESLSTAYTIAGVAANARLGYRYGGHRNDVISGDFLFASGDDADPTSKRYTGVITGNTWGSPGAAFTSSGAYLLLPHLNVVSRFYSAVQDLSNMGYGLTAGTLNLSHEVWRNRLTLKVGGAVGLSNIAPTGGGSFIGVEGNAMVALQIRAFMSLELHGAYLKLGDFYDSPLTVQAPSSGPLPPGAAVRPTDPWTSFLAFKWLMF